MEYLPEKKTTENKIRDDKFTKSLKLAYLLLTEALLIEEKKATNEVRSKIIEIILNPEAPVYIS